MIDRSKDIADFNARVASMAERLAPRGVTIVHREYSAEVFGSWHLIVGNAKKRLDFRYEGKDSYLIFRDAAITPKDYRDLQHKTFRTWEGEDPLVYVEDVLAREFPSDEKRGTLAISRFMKIFHLIISLMLVLANISCTRVQAVVTPAQLQKMTPFSAKVWKVVTRTGPAGETIVTITLKTGRFSMLVIEECNSSPEFLMAARALKPNVSYTFPQCITQGQGAGNEDGK